MCGSFRARTPSVSASCYWMTGCNNTALVTINQSREITMKQFFIAAIVAIFSINPAFAGGPHKSPPNQQVQGQLQGQTINNNQVYREAPAAPSMSTGNNCAVAASLGVSGTSAGVYVPLSVGATWQSRNCQILREAEFLAAHGGSALGVSHATHIRRVRETVTRFYAERGDGGGVVMGGDK